MKDSNKVQVFAIREAYRGSSVFVAPYFDVNSMKFFVGDKSYDAVEAKNPNADYKYRSEKSPMLLTDSLQIRISHGDTFDTTDPKEDMVVQMAIDRGVLAKTIADVNIGKADQIFYLKDDQLEARETAKRADLVFEALGLIRNLVAAEKAALAYRFDAPVRTMNDIQVDAFISDLSMREPEKILSTLTSNDDWKLEGWLTKAVHYGVLTLENGAYRLGGEVVALDKALAVSWLKDKQNQPIVDQLKAKLKELRNEEKAL